MSIETVQLLLAELALVIAATTIYVGGAFIAARGAWNYLGLAALGLAGYLLATSASAPAPASPAAAPAAAAQAAAPPAAPAAAPATPAAAPAPYAAALPVETVAGDPLARFVRWLALAVGAVVLLMTARPADNSQAPEQVATVLVAVAGLMFVAGASDLALLFLGLELISIPSYILLYLGRRDAGSQEAAAKYFFLSILASGLMLYGFSYLYGVAGSTRFELLAERFASLAAGGGGADGLPGELLLARVALVLVIAGLGFKVAAVPFHFYAPDVYQGTTQANAALLAVVPKIAGFVALVRLVVVALPGLEGIGWRVALILALLTMTLGNVLALWQDHVRRLLACSSIAHSGYLLIGVAVALGAAAGGGAAPAEAMAAVALYLALYAFGTLGAFAALTYLGTPEKQVDAVDDLAGAVRARPLAAAALAICLFSLAGIPPLAGFWGKYALFSGAVTLGLSDDPASAGMARWFLILASVAAVNAAIAAAYYLRIVGAMYFRTPLDALPGGGGRRAGLAMLGCAAACLVLGAWPGAMIQGALEAGRGLAAARAAAVATATKPAAPPQAAAAAQPSLDSELAADRSR